MKKHCPGVNREESSAAMIAYGVTQFYPVTDEKCFVSFETAIPSPGPHDVLVKVHAIAVNPVDTKVRAMQKTPLDEPKILGWDASGEVVALGSEVTRFRIGDPVYYAGDITRPGCNAQYQCVDERIVGRKPQRLTHEEAASLPLTTLTAWEGMIDRMKVESGKTILIIGGAGGVGSVAIQLAKQAGLTVIATASRPETIEWCERMGADHVINHHENLLDQCAALGFAQVDYIANFVNTDLYWQVMSELIAPQGSLLLIVEPREALRIGDPLKAKCVSIHWEFMFARAKFQTHDLARQGEILNQLASSVDAGIIQHTATAHHGVLSPESLCEVHGILEKGQAIGKMVLTVSHA
jgi:NADPH2:quinone reductase